MNPMQTLAEWRKQVAVPVMQALDREVANAFSRSAQFAAGRFSCILVHMGGERHLIWRCLENGGCG